jgi:hypothetical protein
MGHVWIHLGNDLIDFSAGDWKCQELHEGTPAGVTGDNPFRGTTTGTQLIV